jgi:membrane-associated phospholipid phosphatase
MKNKIAFAASFFAVAAFYAFSYLYIDISVAAFFYETKPLNSFFEIVTKFGASKWYLIAFAIFFLLFRYIFRLKEAANRFLYLFLAVAGSGLIVDVLKFVFGRARPKLFFEQNIYGIKFFGTEHLYYSFPSGHSATAFSLAVGTALFFPRFALPLFMGAAFVAFSRIAINAHYLGDIVVGAYIGAVFALWLKTKMENKGIRF